MVSASRSSVKSTLLLMMICAGGTAFATDAKISSARATRVGDTCSFNLPNDALGSSISCRLCSASPGPGPLYGLKICGRGGEKVHAGLCGHRNESSCKSSGYTGDICLPYGNINRGYAEKGQLFCFAKAGYPKDGVYEAVYCDGVRPDRRTPILRNYDRRGREDYTRAECRAIGAKIMTPF